MDGLRENGSVDGWMDGWMDKYRDSSYNHIPLRSLPTLLPG